MILDIVKYGTPVLRERGAVVETITPKVKRLIGDMLETMYAFKGVGLAAQQVGVPLQVTVIDVRGVTDRPSTMRVNGLDVDPGEFMPLVLVNPEVKPLADPVIGPEGCLSFPEIYADISRPERVEVQALNEKGEAVVFQCGGLLARAVQHETDHLRGILFIDRMDRKTKQSLKQELELLQAETKAAGA
ncbi:MAG TPA: peptide deformylase [Clostridia bacterium]|nr:peptide deformylase [Clostridia bacterium]